MGRGIAKFKNAPTGVAGAAISGGQLIQWGSGGTAGMLIPAVADSVTCVGVAQTDAQPASNTLASGTTGYGSPFLDASVPISDVAYDGDGYFLLLAGATIAEGVPLKCGAAGTVVPWVDGTDAASRRVGRCFNVGGIANGSRGLCKIAIS